MCHCSFDHELIQITFENPERRMTYVKGSSFSTNTKKKQIQREICKLSVSIETFVIYSFHKTNTHHTRLSWSLFSQKRIFHFNNEKALLSTISAIKKREAAKKEGKKIFGERRKILPFVSSKPASYQSINHEFSHTKGVHEN